MSSQPLEKPVLNSKEALTTVLVTVLFGMWRKELQKGTAEVLNRRRALRQLSALQAFGSVRL